MKSYSHTMQRCPSCHSKGNLIPHGSYRRDIILPYAQNSLFFFLRILGEYFLHSKTVSEIYHSYAITLSTLYCWKALFLCHKAV